MPRSSSEESCSTGIKETRPGHPTVSKSIETVSTGYLTHRSPSAIGSPTNSQKTALSRTTVPKLHSSGKVPSSHNRSAISSPTTRSQKLSPSDTTVPRSSQVVPTGGPTVPRASPKTSVSPTIKMTTSQKMSPSNTTVPRSSQMVPTGRPTIPGASPKTSVSPTIKTTSDQKPKSSFSRGPFPTSTKTPKSSPLEPPPASSTTAISTITYNSRTSTRVSATKTLTVSNGQTARAQVGWRVVGVGVGGSVAVDGIIIPIAGGTAGVIVASSPGQDKLDPDTSITSTSTSKLSSRSTSRSTTSPTARPTPYNIYPKLDSTPPQQSAFERDLERIAQSGSVQSITGVRDKLLLWVANLTPDQASELGRNPVVSPVPFAIYCISMTLVIVKNSRIKSTVQVDSPTVNHVSKYVIIYLHNPVLQVQVYNYALRLSSVFFIVFDEPHSRGLPSFILYTPTRLSSLTSTSQETTSN